MHINELCKQLKDNFSNRLVFFSEVKDSKFFKHFKEQGVFQFDHYTEEYMCKYILSCYEEKVATTKDIIDILKYNFKEANREFQPRHTIPLLDTLSFAEIEHQVEIPERFLTDSLIRYLLHRKMVESEGLTKTLLQLTDKNYLRGIPM